MATQFPASITTLGSALRHLRNARGLTIRGLAAKIGLSAAFISDLEQDRRSTNRIGDIAEALDVKVEDLQCFDSRYVTARVRMWMDVTPGVGKLLMSMMDDGRPVDELQELFD